MREVYHFWFMPLQWPDIWLLIDLSDMSGSGLCMFYVMHYMCMWLVQAQNNTMVNMQSCLLYIALFNVDVFLFILQTQH